MTSRLRLAILGWLLAWHAGMAAALSADPGGTAAARASGISAAILAPTEHRIALWRHVDTIADPDGHFTPGQVEAKVRNGDAEKLPHANFAYGAWLPYPYWARFTLKNPGPDAQQRLLTYELPTQDGVRLWARDPSDAWTHMPQLDEQRSAVASGQLYPAWRVHLAAREERDFLLRIDGYNLMRFPLFAMHDDLFAQQQRALCLGIGFVLAVPLVIMLYLLTLIRIAEDESLPLFLAMAVCEMVGAAWVSGLMHAMLPWLDRWTSGWIGWTGYVVMLGLSCRHARLFMDTGRQDRLADRLLRAGAWIWLMAVPAMAWLRPDASRLTLLAGGTIHAFLLTWLAIRGYLRQRLPHGRLFVAVWAVYAASGILYVLYRLADLPIHITLVSNFIQGALVASLLGCAVSMQMARRREDLHQQIEREQDRALLYAAAHHDLWQPLQSIGLYAKALEEATRPQHRTLLKGMDAAMTAVNDFMAGWQQMSGRQATQPELQTFVLDELLGPVVEEYRHWCRAKHITLRYRPVDFHVHSDPHYLQRILRNLLSNAMRYTDAGGRILVGCRRHAGQRWLVVMDTGIGMSEEQAAQCFEAFRRFGDVEKVPEGMGIGLYSVKKMACALGLQTRLVSVAGKGTMVAVSL